MKALKLIILVMALFLVGITQAQVSLNVNTGTPPMWGPVGYSNVQYYYLPDVQSYYDIHSSKFIYQSGGVWVHRAYLPSRYKNYDLYNGYKVVMTDYHGKKPYIHHKDYQKRYAKGYRGPMQKNIGERPEKGNSGAKMHSGGHSYKKSNQAKGNSKSNGNSSMKKGNSKGGGHGKQK